MSAHLGKFLLVLLVAAMTAYASEFPPKSETSEKGSGGVVQTNRHISNPLDEIYDSPDVPLAIPDGGFVESELEIADSYTVGDVNVFVNITHTYDRDIIIILESPDGTQDTLFNRRGGSQDNIYECTFDDEAEFPISAGSAPFNGSWRPEHELSAFDGESVNGTWLLIVSDNEAADEGTIDSWGMEVSALAGNVGHIYGVVTDSDGGEVVGATVNFVQLGMEFCTDQLGEFLVENIPPGLLTINVTHELFNDWSDEIVLDSGALEIVQVELTDRNIESRITASTAPPEDILDLDSAFMSITVDEEFDFNDVNCEINLSHTWTGDLVINLVSPSGTRVLLAENLGAGGTNYEDCVFSDESCTSIFEAVPPFTGTWRPEEALSAFDGESAVGEWTLIVEDQAEQDTGRIENWTLILSIAEGVFIDETEPTIAQNFTFHGAYPNPFNAQTTFSFDLARAGNVSLKLYDLLGRETAQILNSSLTAGSHEISFNASDLPSGLYFASLTSAGKTQTQKIVLLK